MSDYQSNLLKLFNISYFGGMKLGLQNMLTLNKLLDFPSDQFKAVHVAGSNGKGSVSTKIATGLQASGKKTGLYTSPHISCFRERIRINGEMISERQVQEGLHKLFSLTKEHQIPCTFFELTTMLALIYFAKEKVDIAVLETGLGGRLDATNIIDPILSVITNISLDHTEILGNSLEDIAFEKAGIIKPKTPVIIGPYVPFEIFNQVALENKSPLVQVKSKHTHFEEENNEIAKWALEHLNTPNEFIVKGLESKPPCRMETFNYLGKTIILDVAHNPDGLTRLFLALREKYPNSPFRLIFGLSQNKDIDACLVILKEKGSSFHLVTAKNGRGMAVLELKKKFPPCQKNLFSYNSIKDAIDCAINNPISDEEIIIICGTFFIMADARSAIAINEPVDCFDMNEKK